MPVLDRSGLDIVRLAPPGQVSSRAQADQSDRADGDDPVLFGHFSVFDRFYEINSPFEGHFMERIAPGTFTETFERDEQRCWFEHGYSATLDKHALGSIRTLREDDVGAYYEVDLFRGLPEFFVQGLRGGTYGASFRMRITGESIDEEPGESEHNPRGIPEVTITRVTCPEFGPVSIGASPFATAGLRSGTEQYLALMKRHDPDGWALMQRNAVESDAIGGAGDGGDKQCQSNTRANAAALALRLKGFQ